MLRGACLRLLALFPAPNTAQFSQGGFVRALSTVWTCTAYMVRSFLQGSALPPKALEAKIGQLTGLLVGPPFLSSLLQYSSVCFCMSAALATSPEYLQRQLVLDDTLMASVSLTYFSIFMQAATFCAEQFVTSFPLGLLSNRVGRKVCGRNL